MRSIRGQCVVIPAWLLRDPASCVLRAMRAHEALRRCVSASCVQTQHEQSKDVVFANLPSRGSLCVQESLSMTSLCTLPKEILRSTLLKLPPNDICSQVNFVNQHLHGQVTKEEFWKELCVVRYCGASSALLSKPPAHSWKQYAFQLEESVIWAECHPSLQITNKSYSLSYPPSSTPSTITPPPSSSIIPPAPSSTTATPPSSSTTPPTSPPTPAMNLCIGVAQKALVAGPFSGRYFEVVVDSLPAGDDVLQLTIGVAPYNILLNPSWEKVSGYTNTGMSHSGSCGKSYGVGDRIGVLLNTEYMTISFLKNDILQGTPYVRLDRHVPLHPVVALLKAGVQVTIPLPPLQQPPPMPLR